MLAPLSLWKQNFGNSSYIYDCITMCLYRENIQQISQAHRKLSVVYDRCNNNNNRRWPSKRGHVLFRVKSSMPIKTVNSTLQINNHLTKLLLVSPPQSVCQPALTLKTKMYPSVGVLLALWALEVAHGQACPRSCNCYQANEVHCTFRSLLTVPAGLPARTRRINLG